MQNVKAADFILSVRNYNHKLLMCTRNEYVRDADVFFNVL